MEFYVLMIEINPFEMFKQISFKAMVFSLLFPAPLCKIFLFHCVDFK